MDFSYPPESEAFRAEVRQWLDANLTDRFRDLGYAADPSGEQLELMREWNRLLADAGYAAIAWPPEYGGRGASIVDQAVLAEELHRAGAPATVNPIGISNIAPAILMFGTDEQKRRFLPRMRRGDDIWCQGFSEPNAGSDLAGLETRAVLDGDAFIVNGQKLWTTYGHLANWCELLVRTDPDAPKHRGISCLLVDMTLPGIDVRPLVTATGDREFNEIFFTDVRVPKDALLGDLNDGWRVAMTTLAHERAGVATLHVGVRSRVADLMAVAVENGRADDPLVRQALARVYLEGEYLKLLGDRAMSNAMKGQLAGPEGSLAKLLWTECESHLAEAAGAVLGEGANAGSWGRQRVHVRSLSVAGGTTQINKNVLAERILGLPRSQ